MGDATIEFIRRILSQTPKQTLKDPELSPAGVMLLFYPKNGEYCILLNRRSEKVQHHKGEISFPGGARDPKDATMLDTALRETEEEMGILPGDIEILGELSDVATYSRFVINTYVGVIPYPYEFKVSTAEIAEVLEVPIPLLMDLANLREEVRMVGGKLVKAYSYAYNGNLIYGATARILTQFLDLLRTLPEKEALWKGIQVRAN